MKTSGAFQAWSKPETRDDAVNQSQADLQTSGWTIVLDACTGPSMPDIIFTAPSKSEIQAGVKSHRWNLATDNFQKQTRPELNTGHEEPKQEEGHRKP